MKSNLVSSSVGGATFVDRPDSQSSTRVLPYLRMSEFGTGIADFSGLADEHTERIKQSVKDFFGDSEVLYAYESDENLIAVMGFIPVQQFCQEDVVNKIVASVSLRSFGMPIFIGNLGSGADFDMVSHIDLITDFVLGTLEHAPPQGII